MLTRQLDSLDTSSKTSPLPVATTPAADQQNDEPAPSNINGDDHPSEDPAAVAPFPIVVKLPHHPYQISVIVSVQEQTQDLRQSIVETPDTFQYTCFRLELEGERINDFAELSELKNLKADSEITLVEAPYTEKEARSHLIRIRDLIGLAGQRLDPVHGIEAGLSLHDVRFASPQPNGTVESAQVDGNGLSNYDFHANGDINTIVLTKPTLPPRTIKALAVSPWNPPPLHLRQRGHLLYLLLTTNEGEQFHINCTNSGFYVSRSSSNKFDPLPRAAPKNHSAHSLLTLISLLSPSFNANFLELQKYNGQKDPLTTFPFQNSIPANPWTVSASAVAASTQQADLARSQEPFLLGGSDGAENLRDWNEEFQTTRELPRDNLQDRVFRERLTSKLFADYNDAAARGAVLVARGEVAPLNPTEGVDAQIFIHNNIFYSFGADGVATFASEGGDEAARVAVGKDVTGVRAVNQLDIHNLYTPGTIVVDYLGKRIVGQSIVPGIFKQREPGEHQIDYGGVEGRDVVTENEAFVPLFEKLSKALHVKKHPVWDKDDKRHDLEGSVETKGLLGTDGRKYVLDLYRITPLDIAWSDECTASEVDSFGSYPHRMSVMRPELVESFWKSKMQEYVKSEWDQRRGVTNGHNETDEPTINGHKPLTDDTPMLPSQEGPKTNGDVEKEPEEPVTAQNGEAKPEEEIERIDVSKFQLTFNPDVCSGQVPQTEDEKAHYKSDEAEVRAICDHLRSHIMPGLITDLYESDVGFPMDGVSLSQLLHKRGINIRYIGRLVKLAQEKGSRLKAFVTVAEQEMIVRAFKHVLNGHLRHLPAVFAPACVSHLLNCLFVSDHNEHPEADIDEDLKSLYPEGDFSYLKQTATGLVKEMERQISMRYRYKLEPDWQKKLKPQPVLREICLRVGLQLMARPYTFDNEVKDQTPTTEMNGALTNGVGHEEGKKKKKKSSESTCKLEKRSTTFSPDDILNIYPILKDAAPKSALADEALETGRLALAQGQKTLGQELILESLSLHEQIYGILHPEVAKMYHQLSMIYYQNDEKEAAVELARKAVIVTERTIGIDSHDTILAYLNLSLLEHHTGNTKQALRYVRHALEIWKIVFGPNHPDSITTMNNAAVMLQSLKLYAESRKWFEACYSICEDLFGKQTINTATILFQLAQALALDGDSKGAVNKMRDAYNIFLAELGANDRNTKEAESWLEQLTQNAVSIARMQVKDLQRNATAAGGRIRRVAYLPTRVGAGIGASLQSPATVAQRSTNGITRSTSNDASDHATAAAAVARSTGLDSRSIDELLRYIEGGAVSSGGRVKQKKRANKTMNPKLRTGPGGGATKLEVEAL